MIAQALSACGHTVPAGAVPDSIHIGLLGGRSGIDVDFTIDVVRDGRALQHREVKGYQEGKLILQATVVSTVPSEGPDWQSVEMPRVGEPDTSGSASSLWPRALGWGVFEVALPTGAPGEQVPSHPVWVRSAVELPDEPWLRAAVVAFWTDFGPNWAARDTHVEVAGPVSSVSATHTIFFHRRTELHRWHLFDAKTLSIAGNQAFVRAAVYEGGGALVASVEQRVFLRRPSAVLKT
jgi:acyl-CoA thioesterase